MGAKKKPVEGEPNPAEPSPAEQSDEELFVRGLLERGEAAKAVDGELPPGATHEIVEEKDGELPKVKRRRFSAF